MAALSGKVEAYFNDHFGFRKRLIYWLAIVKVQGLGVTSTPGVTLGTNGWLYLASDSAVQSYRVVRPFTSGQLEAFRQLLEAGDWLAARNPVSAGFCAQQGHDLPRIHARRLNKLHPESRLDQLLDYMRGHSSVPIVDVREDLRRARQVERVYDVTDSHWNSSGGYIAYERMHAGPLRVVSQAQAVPRSEFRAVVDHGPGGDLGANAGHRRSNSRRAIEARARNPLAFPPQRRTFPDRGPGRARADPRH